MDSKYVGYYLSMRGCRTGRSLPNSELK